MIPAAKHSSARVVACLSPLWGLFWVSLSTQGSRPFGFAQGKHWAVILRRVAAERWLLIVGCETLTTV